MRTTLSIQDTILEAARREALARHLSLAKFIEEAVRDNLARETHETAEPYRELVTFKGNGLIPGVDLNDSRTLLDVVDGRS
jgi:hypothetical protein